MVVMVVLPLLLLLLFTRAQSHCRRRCRRGR